MPARVVGEEMRSYYDRRAPDYDDWWQGTGLFAKRERPGWGAEVSELVAVVSGLEPADVLDVACGTGFLTRHLRAFVSLSADELLHARLRIFGEIHRIVFLPALTAEAEWKQDFVSILWRVELAVNGQITFFGTFNGGVERIATADELV